MTFGIVIRNQNNIVQLDNDYQSLLGGAILTVASTVQGGWLGTSNVLLLSGDWFPTNSILLIRNLATTSYQQFVGADFYDQSQNPPTGVSRVSVSVSGSYKIFLAKPSIWSNENTGYGVLLRDPTGLVCFSSNQVNFRFTTTITETITASFVSTTIDYPISKGIYTGDTYFAHNLADGVCIKVNSTTVFQVSYQVYLVSETLLRIVYVRGTNFSPYWANNAPTSTTITVLTGVRT